MKVPMPMSELRVLSDAFIPELPNRYNGKVRENYDLPDGSRIIIATDRLSAFDIILTSIPYKGQVLTQTARYWFEETADICPNHVISYPDPNVVIGKRLDILPVEIVVRGYLAGTTSTSIGGPGSFDLPVQPSWSENAVWGSPRFRMRCRATSSRNSSAVRPVSVRLPQMSCMIESQLCPS